MTPGNGPSGNRGSPPSGGTSDVASGMSGLHASPASSWVAALAKATRAFVLYEPGNAVIRQFLADYAERSRQVLAQGALTLEVAPYEILREGEVIYRERDRERSLAFRLFRDGVRGITVDPAVNWEELLLFLQILAVRFTGVQQQEEDIVTLLWKAEFRGLSFQVVQGFASEDEEPGAGAGAASGAAAAPQGNAGAGGEEGGSGGSVASSGNVSQELAKAAEAAGAVAALASQLRSEPPPHWDEPLPRLPHPAAIAYRPVAGEELQDLRSETTPEALPAAALGAVRDLLAEAARSGSTALDPAFEQFVKEVRLFLLGEGELVQVMELAGVVGRHQGGAAVETDLLHELGDPKTVEKILQSIPEEDTEPPPKLASVLGLIRLDPLLDLFVAEKRPARRTLLLGLARGRLPADGDALLARISSLDPPVALELLSTFAERDPERASRGAGPLLSHPVPEIRLGALAMLEASPGEVQAGPLLKLLRTSQEEAVRVRALQLLGAKGEPAAFEGVERWVEEHRELSLVEAEVLGRALAQLAPIPASRLFTRWLRSEKGVFKALRDSGQKRALVWSAVSGLGALPGASAQQQLDAVAQQATGDLRRHCLSTLARRRREGGGHG